jgi:hypothetical protein
VSVLLLLPMMVRNYRIDGSLLPTRSGINLFVGNSPYSDKLIPAYDLDLLVPYAEDLFRRENPQWMKASEKEKDDFFTQKAIEYMRENPWETLKLKLKNVIYFLQPQIIPSYGTDQGGKLVFSGEQNVRVENASPQKVVPQFIYACFYSFTLIAGLMGICLRVEHFRTDLMLYLVLFGFILIYSVYFPSSRYRVSMDFVLIFYSAFATAQWIPRA